MDKNKLSIENKYQKPQVEVIDFDYSDVIATSICGSPGVCPMFCRTNTCTDYCGSFS